MPASRVSYNPGSLVSRNTFLYTFIWGARSSSLRQYLHDILRASLARHTKVDNKIPFYLVGIRFWIHEPFCPRNTNAFDTRHGIAIFLLVNCSEYRWGKRNAPCRMLYIQRYAYKKSQDSIRDCDLRSPYFCQKTICSECASTPGRSSRRW